MVVGTVQPAASIVRLQDDVVARMAAGEVLQRPASALKELLDNAIDAGASQVAITVGDSPAKMLQVQDNGSGIQAADFPFLCTRHATSKLRRFEDLVGVGTLGFRGEAMASVSHVSHLTVTSMAAGHSHGMRATFCDGSMLDCQPCAASQGTSVLVEDMFYNAPSRQKALAANGTEYARMLAIVSQYAVFHTSVGFSIRRVGRPPDLQTPAGGSQLELIGKIFGASVRSAMAPICTSHGNQAWLDRGRAAEVPQDAQVYVAQGFLSVRRHSARSTLILRVNSHVVQWPALKRALEASWSSHGSTGCLPFVVLDVQLPSMHVDVNLHPTKAEVAILHEDAVIHGICDSVHDVLKHHHEMQAVRTHPGAGKPAGGQPEAARVRTDDAAQTIASLARGPVVQPGCHIRAIGAPPVRQSSSAAEPSTEDLDAGLVDILKRHVSVGVSGHWWLLQHGSHLHLLDLRIVGEELAQQQALLVSGLLPRIRLHPCPLISAALGAADLQHIKSDDSQQTDRVQAASDMIMRHTDLLRDSFGVDISASAHLSALPDLLCGILPSVQRVAVFLAQLSNCLSFRGAQQRAAIVKALATLYTWSEKDCTDVQGIVRLAQQVWKPSRACASRGVLLQVASLHDLYRAFERC